MVLRWCKHGTGPIPCVIVKLATWFTSAVHRHTRHWWSWTYWTVSGTFSSKRFPCCLRQRYGLVLVTLKMTRRDQYGTEHIQLGSQNSALRLRSKPKGTATLRSHAGSQNKRYSVLITKLLCFLSSPKIFGGHAQEGPTSPWALQNVRRLEQFQDSRRFAFFMCAFAGSAHRRPLAVLTTTTSFEADCYAGWPILQEQLEDLQYIGPLPRRALAQNNTQSQLVFQAHTF